MAQPVSMPSTSSFSQVNGDFSVAVASSSSSSSSLERQEEDYQRFDRDRDYHGYHLDRHRNAELEHQHDGILNQGNFAAANDTSSVIRDDRWSCIVVVLTFWFFVSMTLILGVYGPLNVRLGPNSSILIDLNPIFVQSIKVKQLDDAKPGLKLYGFNERPALDVVATWTEIFNLSVPADSHKEWIRNLNEGSHINISYSLKSEGFSLLLVIARGSEGLAHWLEDPAYPNTTLSWSLIHGSGMIQQQIYRSSSYYVAVGNLNSIKAKVKLDIGIRTLLYNTTESFYKCAFGNRECIFNVRFPQGNAVVLTSPALEQEGSGDEWYVRLSYKPRWITYIAGIGGITALMLVASNFLNNFRFVHEDENLVRNSETASQRAPLLSNKDDDHSSLGSSYDSVSTDDGDLEDFMAAGSLGGKSELEGENSNFAQHLCVICVDAPRDCFFLPCGHCVSCFECGKRIAEAAGACPICRRKMKKVRRIYTV